ncbi:MAG: T9SS type A sorting domain-containing protein [Bacteroidia bacterium]|nr:T9SS type A sorting domain-containing protein [Bacteroidia bacterium]
MKKILTAFLLFGVIGSLNAQTLSLPDVKPQIGEKFVMHRAQNQSALSPGNSGAGQVWDLSAAVFDEGYDLKYEVITASSAPGVSQFNNPSYAVRWYQSDSTLLNYVFMKDSANYLFKQGENQSVLFIRYPDADLTMHLPLAYQDSLGDSSFYSSTAFSVSYYYQCQTSLKFDGSGTLKLPYATLTGVYRLKHTIRQIRQSFNDTSYYTRYYWYRPGIAWPVAEYREYIGSDHIVYTNIDMLDIAPPLSTGKVNKINAALYPNPALNQINLSLKMEAEPMKLFLYTVQGKLVLEQEVTAGLQVIETGNLVSGLYFIRLESKGETLSLPFIKK